MLKLVAGENAGWLDAYNYYWAQNRHFERRDIATRRNTNWDECGALCKTLDNCKFFTYVPLDDSICYLKKSFDKSNQKLK